MSCCDFETYKQYENYHTHCFLRTSVSQRINVLMREFSPVAKRGYEKETYTENNLHTHTHTDIVFLITNTVRLVSIYLFSIYVLLVFKTHILRVLVRESFVTKVCSRRRLCGFVKTDTVITVSVTSTKLRMFLMTNTKMEKNNLGTYIFV